MHTAPRIHSFIPLLLPLWAWMTACGPLGEDGGPHGDGAFGDGVEGERDNVGGSTPIPEAWNDIPPCGSEAALAGTLYTNVSDVTAHDSGYATVDVSHRVDGNVGDDACVTRVEILARLHPEGCELHLELATDGQGLARLQSASFVADSFCPGFLDDAEGRYDSPSSEGAPLWPASFPVRVPDREALSSCLPGTLIDFPDHDLVLYPVAYGREPLTINLRDLMLYGSFTTTGHGTTSTPAVCAQSTSCPAGMHDGGDGWCADEGSCADGYMPQVDSLSQCVDCAEGTKVYSEGLLHWCLEGGGASSPNLVDVELPFLEEEPVDMALGQARLLRFVVPAGSAVDATVTSSSGIYVGLIETPDGTVPPEDLYLAPCDCRFLVEAAPVERTFTLFLLGVGSYYWEETSFGLYRVAIEGLEE